MRMSTIGAFDPDHAWDGISSHLFDGFRPAEIMPRTLLGAYGGAYRSSDGRWRLTRDPLGINKVFWATHAGELFVAARPHRLVAHGVPFENIFSLPRGALVDSGDGARGDDGSRTMARSGSPPRPLSDVPLVAASIRDRLDGYLDALRRDRAGHPVFVCLSGGIDSTGIAILAREHIPDVTFASFDLRRSDSPPSEDRVVARRIADDLGVPLLEIDVSIDELFGRLDSVLIEGVDWRDFNVHAALVNSALATGIRESIGATTTALVLSGDLANEFVADYAPESVRGTVSYRLPSVPIGTLRRLLVNGLDTSHREVGIFAAEGLHLVQPSAVVVDEYMSLPDAFLELPDRKERMVADITRGRIPGYVLERPKVRAQVGGLDGGVLGAFLDRGIDQAALRSRFAALHSTHPRTVDRFIRGGLYRSSTPSVGVTGPTTSKGISDAA
ncbi:MAG: asparagine synthase C-terminal domain-containing protein [Chloroflexota bacterium]